MAEQSKCSFTAPMISWRLRWFLLQSWRCRGSVRSPASVDKISVDHLFSSVLCYSVLVQVPTGTSLVSYQCPLTAVILGSQRLVWSLIYNSVVTVSFLAVLYFCGFQSRSQPQKRVSPKNYLWYPPPGEPDSYLVPTGSVIVSLCLQSPTAS